MPENMDVEQERQNIFYDRGKYGPNYKVGEEVLVFNPTVKKGETRIFTSFYRGPYTIVEIINDLIFRVDDKKTKKAIKVHNDRIKNIKRQKNQLRLSLRQNKKQQLGRRKISLWTAKRTII